jgi:hypothetical protein
MSILIVPWKKTTFEGQQMETIKWTYANSRYEIHAPVLEVSKLIVWR